MPRRRTLSSPNCFRNAPALCLAGLLVLAGDSNFCAKLFGQQSAFGFFAVALAGEDDEGHHSKHPATVDNAGKESGSRTGTGSGHTGGADGKHRASSHTDGIPLGSHQASLSLDANRGMMKVHFPLGGHLPLGGHHESHSVLHAS